MDNSTSGNITQFPKSRDLIKRAWYLYKKNIRKIWAVSFLGSLGLLFGSSFLGYSSFFFENIYKFMKFGNFQFPLFLFSLGEIFLSILIVVFSELFLIVFYKNILSIQSGENIKSYNSFKSAFKILKSFIWITFLVALIRFSGFLLLIIPGVFLSIILMFSDLELVFRGKKGLNALIGSMNLCKGLFFKILKVNLFITLRSFLISLGLSILVILPLFGLLFVGSFLDLGAKILLVITLTSAVLIILTSLAIFTLVFSLLIISFIELYRDILKIKNQQPLDSDVSNSIINSRNDSSDKVEKYRLKKIILVVLTVFGFLMYPFYVAVMYEFNSSFDLRQNIDFGRSIIYEDSMDNFRMERPENFLDLSEDKIESLSPYHHAIRFLPSDSGLKGQKDEKIGYLFQINSFAQTSGLSLDSLATSLVETVKKKNGANLISINVASTTIASIPTKKIDYYLIDGEDENIFISNNKKGTMWLFILGNRAMVFEFVCALNSCERRLKQANDMVMTLDPYFDNSISEYNRIYTNYDYNVRFKFPLKWFSQGEWVKDNILNVRFFDLDDRYLKDQVSNNAFSLMVSKIGKKENVNLDTILSSIKKELETTSEFLVKEVKKERILNNVEAYKIILKQKNITTAKEAQVKNSFIFIHNGRFYTIAFHVDKAHEHTINEIINSFEVMSDLEDFNPGTGYTLHENKQFGTKIYVPIDWKLYAGNADLFIAEGYKLPYTDSHDPYAGVFSFGLPSFIDYKESLGTLFNEVLQSWKSKLFDSNLEILETGTTEISGLKAYYFVAEYDNNNSSKKWNDLGKEQTRIKVKQWILIKGNVFRYVTYTDDIRDFDKKIISVEKALSTLELN